MGSSGVGLPDFEANQQAARCNVLIVGKTGAGKSTLVNALLGEEAAETGTGLPVTKGFKAYDAGRISVLDSEGFKLGASVAAVENVVAAITERAPDDDSQLHVAWLCIESTTPRIQPLEERCIKEVAALVPVIVVITQAAEPRRCHKLADEVRKHCPSVENVAIVVAKDIQLTAEDRVEANGLDTLLAATRLALPKGREMAFVNGQRASLPMKRELASTELDDWIKANDSGAIKKLADLWAVDVVPGNLQPISEDLQTLLQRLSEPFGGSVSSGTFVKTLMSTILSHSHQVNWGAPTGNRKRNTQKHARERIKATCGAYLDVCLEVVTKELDGVTLSQKALTSIVQKVFIKTTAMELAPKYLPQPYPPVVFVSVLALGELLMDGEEDKKRRQLMRKRLKGFKTLLTDPEGVFSLPESAVMTEGGRKRYLSDAAESNDAARWLLVDTLFSDPFAASPRSKDVGINIHDRFDAVRELATWLRLDQPGNEIDQLQHIAKVAAGAHAPAWRRRGVLAFIGGMVVIVATGGIGLVAAPIIGAALGASLFGLSGAAATSAGLAALGGGALAAGGAGMMGGMVVIAGILTASIALTAGGASVLVRTMSPLEVRGMMIKIQTLYAFALKGPSAGKGARAYAPVVLKQVEKFRDQLVQGDANDEQTQKKEKAATTAIEWMHER